MKKIVCILFVILTANFSLCAQNREERNELMQLLEQRQKMFDSYASSLKKKTGIFGQKTKNDLRATHEELKRIVEVDNRIMTRLRQLLDYTKFEKQTMSYDVNQYAEQLKNFERNQDTLVKQLAIMEKENAKLNSSTSKSGRWLYFLFGILFAVALFLLRRKVKERLF